MKGGDIMDLIPRKFYLDDLFDDLMVPERNGSMKCDIYEENNKYHIEMDVPGFKKEEIKLDCNKGYLTISAEKHNKTDEHDKKYLRKERTYAKYERSFYLGDCDETAIDAEYKDGTLYITVPKKENNSSKKYIAIK
jgi:HSP20 family protein